MKIKQIIVAWLLVVASPAHSDPITQQSIYFFDIVLYRPVGLIATAIGSAVFVATSPLTALATISPPHDAFDIAAGMMVVAPAKFTFDRPLGVIYPDADGNYRRH